MPPPTEDRLPYTADSLVLAQCLHDLPGFVWLETGEQNPAGTDFISALPAMELVQHQGVVERRTLGRVPSRWSVTGTLSDLLVEAVTSDPCGDWLGYFGYDVAEQTMALRAGQPAGVTPSLCFARYDWAILVDHQNRLTSIRWHSGCSDETRQRVLARLSAAADRIQTPPFRLRQEFVPDQTRSQYHTSFRRIQDYIRAGDCYQINYAQRFSATYSGDPWGAFVGLRSQVKAPYGAFLRTSTGAILSFSPEQFLQVRDGRVQTAPIKGTRPRGRDANEEARLKLELANSLKDRAENLMIVDLLRNDLGRHSEVGTVRVDRLFELQTFRNVHHLVSTISSTLKADVHPLRLFVDAFPGGSITGAPKRRAMEIIAELEPHRRSVYCGSILWWSSDRILRSNIAIRTLVCEQGEIHCWGGGGIVADSDEEMEYQESINKVAIFMRTLEQLSSEHSG